MFPGMKISAVSYLNTVPFVYGLRHADLPYAQLLLSPPSKCAENFANGTANIALLPSAALPSLHDYKIVTPYCIGAVADVRTVVIVSDSPIDRTRRLFLDSHSLTSAALSQILCNELWHIAPERLPMPDETPLAQPREGDAFLLIGDKVFAHEGRFRYSYDLARAWRELTSLPFVFALWVARKDVPQESIVALETALRLGIGHIAAAIEESSYAGLDYAYDYLINNIDYNLDAPKQEALGLFLKKLTNL